MGDTKTIEDRIAELKAQQKEVLTKRNEIMKTVDENTLELMKIGGAIEELSKLLDNVKGDKK